MKFLKTILLTTLLVSLLPTGFVNAKSYDFNIEHNMTIKYATNTDYVNVTIEYIRKVNNNDYFFPASGEKVITIPDITTQQEDAITSERIFKKESLEVTDSNGKDIKYEIKEVEGEGIYVHIPNYKQTTPTSPYKIYISYNTHDYVKAVYDHITLQGPSLPKDTEFEIAHSDSKTSTKVDYSLSFEVDQDIPDLAKIWPEGYEISEDDGIKRIVFPSSSRIGRNPYMEFGTRQIYKFEVRYTTPKTDNLIPTDSPKIINSLSKNIYEISLPRGFDETNQQIKIESITPKPTQINMDEQGNIIGTFEVAANSQEEISIVGYIWVEQNSLDSKKVIPNMSIEEYREEISSNQELLSYLRPTKYWEVNDTYIQAEAKATMEGQTSVLDLIKANYRYINEKLEYDQDKAVSQNERIGAKNALQGGASVCMEYADSMISLLRAQGIASRAAIGYANLNLPSHTPESQVRHQWVQVWIPEYGWLSVDPTLESENMDIGQNIDRVLWETFTSDSLSNTKIFSADKIEDIDKLEFNVSVYAVRETDIKGELQSYGDIKEISQGGENILNKVIKTSSFGRALLIIAPITLLILILVISISVIRYAIKKSKRKKA